MKEHEKFLKLLSKRYPNVQLAFEKVISIISYQKNEN